LGDKKQDKFGLGGNFGEKKMAQWTHCSFLVFVGGLESLSHRFAQSWDSGGIRHTPIKKLFSN
jgi:hypothetical protein